MHVFVWSMFIVAVLPPRQLRYDAVARVLGVIECTCKLMIHYPRMIRASTHYYMS